tara:strand:- start:831 stop:2459 length:1629 start_codon:yes stop_codon:yes gene_type:complete
VLRLENITKAYPTGIILNDVSWDIKAGERIGLIGQNGAGKSTQLRIIAGLEEPSSGSIIFEGNPKVSLLNQELKLKNSNSVKTELFSSFTEEMNVLNELKKIEANLSSGIFNNDKNMLQKEIDRLSFYQDKFEALNGYKLESEVEKLLSQIGFNQNDANKLIHNLSGGWKMRVALGKIILQKPDILLLDEPTNHLDINTISWLENYLFSLKTAIIIVSHDRYFLDRLCTKIVNINNGISKSYLGNYSNFIKEKEFQDRLIIKKAELQSKEIESQRVFIDRFKAKATRSKQAKSREKQLAKVEKIIVESDKTKKISFEFQKVKRSGKDIFKIINLSHSYEDKILFLDANLIVERGQKIAFIGPNGSGKSTLLRLILNIEKPEFGKVELGNHHILPTYFEQNQAEALPLKRRIIDLIYEKVPDWTQSRVRTFLANFGFIGESVFNMIENISGGEKARLALALIILTPSNFLILDEPTNHLDITTKTTLENSIENYDGTVLIVSHDRYFISKVANKIVEIRDGELIYYNGNYEYYLSKKKLSNPK